jgi:adenylosuccinate lyase
MDLAEHWNVIGEAIQTVMRRFGDENAYEKLRDLTRGQEINHVQLQNFIQQLNIPDDFKKVLSQLTPENYIGLAPTLVKAFS